MPLKLLFEWRPRTLLELLDRLYKVISLQFSDLRLSLYCHNNCTVALPFARTVPNVTHSLAGEDTEIEKDVLVDAFLTFTPAGKSQRQSKHRMVCLVCLSHRGLQALL